MLHEAAATADKIAAGQISMDDGRAYLTSFAEQGLGLAPHLLAPVAEWFDGAGFEVAAAEQPAAQSEKSATEQPAQPAPPPPAPVAAAPARPAMATPDRAAVIARAQAAMRAEPSSDEAKWYWRQGGSEQYRVALEAKQAADAAPPMPAGGHRRRRSPPRPPRPPSRLNRVTGSKENRPCEA